MPAKFDRCVRGVKKRSKGRVNAYAVCTAAGTRDQNPGYGRHLDDNYAPITLYRYFTTKQAAQSYLRLNSWPGGVESKRGGWPGSRDWAAGEEFRVKVPDGGTTMIGRRNPIQDPNSSGQGYDPDHVQVPYEGILSRYGYTYSHSTPVVYQSGRRIHHTYKKGNHNVGVDQTPNGVWKWDAGSGGSGRSYGGSTAEALEKYLKGRQRKGNPDRLTAKKFYEFGTTRGTQDRQSSSVGLSVDPDVQSRSGFSFIWDRALSNGEVLKKDEQKYRQQFFDGYYNAYSNLGKRYRRRNPESGAESMYESFHGAPSEEVLEFREDEHYHGNLAGLGVLVELKLVTTTGYDVTLTFSDPEALIASNPPQVGVLSKMLDGTHVLEPDNGLKSYHAAREARDAGRIKDEYQRVAKVKSILKNFRVMVSPGPGGSVRVYRPDTQQEFFIGGTKSNPGIWDRLKRIGSKSTVYHVPKHSERMTKATVYQGREIFKTQEGDYRVPSLERESSFDSLADAKKFVGAWKGNPGGKRPVPRELMPELLNLWHLSRTAGKSSRYDRMLWAQKEFLKIYPEQSPNGVWLDLEKAISHGMNPGPFQSASQLIGSTGKYLDNQLGRVLNKRNPVSLDPALLCSNEDGTQLYIQGGDQSVDLKSIHMADVPVKDSMVLGEAYFVSYFTEKDFDDHQPTIYEHDLAEESDPPKPKYRKDEVHTAANRPGLGQGSGCYPTVRYDVLNQRVYLDGGDYEIKKPLMGTSPGIEN